MTRKATVVGQDPNHDLALLNRHAEQLNEEAEDVLKYQVDL